MKQLQIQINLGLVALGIGLLFSVFLLVSTWNKVEDKRLRMEAIQGCMEVSSYQTVDQNMGVTSTVPMMDMFDICMKQKGY